MGMMKLIAGAALALSVSFTASAAEELKFANFMPAGHPYVSGAFQPFADAVAKSTDGKVTVKLFSGGELGPGPVDQINRAISGVADLAVGLQGYTASNFPLTLLSELPGVLDEKTGTQTLWDHVDLFKSEYRRVQLVSLWSNASNLLYMREKPVRTVEDIKGLKIRVPSRNAGLIVQAWGATPVSMPVSDIYNAMQTGVIDGAMIDGTATKAFKLGEVSKYLTVGLHTTISPFFIVMNRDAFEGLSDSEQQAVLDAGKAASFDANKVQLSVAEKGISSFAEAEGKEVITPSPEAVAEFDKLADAVTGQVVAEEQAKGLDAEAVVKALKGE